jgi:hypothetical protein
MDRDETRSGRRSPINSFWSSPKPTSAKYSRRPSTGKYLAAHRTSPAETVSTRIWQKKESNEREAGEKDEDLEPKA